MVDACKGGCPFQEALDLLGRRYSLSVLWALQQRSPRRFTDIKHDLGVNPVTLSQRLTELQEAGVITRQAFDEVPPRVEYALTEKGHDLLPLLEGLEQWADKYDHGAAPAAPTPPASPVATVRGTPPTSPTRG